MEFINQQISFTERVIRKAIPSAIIKLLIVSIVAFATNSFIKDNLEIVSILVGAVLLAVIIFEFYRNYKDCINWIELFIINEERQTCTLRLLQKDNLYKAVELPITSISCKEKTKSRGRDGNRYFLEIYYNNEYLFDVSDAIISRYKLLEILKYFNNETT